LTICRAGAGLRKKTEVCSIAGVDVLVAGKATFTDASENENVSCSAVLIPLQAVVSIYCGFKLDHDWTKNLPIQTVQAVEYPSSNIEAVWIQQHFCGRILMQTQVDSDSYGHSY
jgi:hypothetical protein